MSLTLKHFLCLLCLFVSLVLVFYWVCYRRVFISTTEQSAVPAESTSFERHSEFVCMCLNHSDVCFHLKSVPLSFHFRSEILNVLGFKKKTFYRSRSRSSLDFGLICSLIGQLHISGVAQTHTCWRGTFVKFAAPPVCLDLWILMSSASSVYT